MILLNLLNSFISPAVAAENISNEISASVYLQAFLSLIFILGILFFATWILRKVSGGRGFGSQKIKVIGGVALSPREKTISPISYFLFSNIITSFCISFP